MVRGLFLPLPDRSAFEQYSFPTRTLLNQKVMVGVWDLWSARFLMASLTDAFVCYGVTSHSKYFCVCYGILL